MNLLTYIILIFIYVFSITYFGLIDLKNSNPLTQKLFIFIALFIFGIFIETIKKINNNCKTTIYDIFVASLTVGFVGFVGQTIFMDLILMPETSSIMNSSINTVSMELILSLFISISILLSKISTYMIHYDCL